MTRSMGATIVLEMAADTPPIMKSYKKLFFGLSLMLVVDLYLLLMISPTHQFSPIIPLIVSLNSSISESA